MSWLKDVLGIQEWRCAIVAGQGKSRGRECRLSWWLISSRARRKVVVGDPDADRLAAAAAGVRHADSRSFFGRGGS